MKALDEKQEHHHHHHSEDEQEPVTSTSSSPSKRRGDFVDFCDENEIRAGTTTLNNNNNSSNNINNSSINSNIIVAKDVGSRNALKPMNQAGGRLQGHHHRTMRSNRTTPPRPGSNGIMFRTSAAAASHSTDEGGSQSKQQQQQRPNIPKNPPPRHFTTANSSTSTTHSSLTPHYSSNNTQHSAGQQQQDWQWVKRSEPDSQEQALFEQRLCEDAYGVAVRKIDRNGKSQLRYVKCIVLDHADSSTGGPDDSQSFSGVSVSSIVRSFRGRKMSPASSSESQTSHHHGPPTTTITTTKKMNINSNNSVSSSHYNNSFSNDNGHNKKILMWGKKKDHKLSLDCFVSVRKGKTTERTKRNPQHETRLLSLITNNKQNPSLDIEAPTRLDRDKFARAFARFLQVPLENDDIINPASHRPSAARSEPDLQTGQKRPIRAPPGSSSVGANVATGQHTLALPATSKQVAEPTREVPVLPDSKKNRNGTTTTTTSSNNNDGSNHNSNPIITGGAIISGFSPDQHEQRQRQRRRRRSQGAHDDDDGGSGVSSLTGAGFDQEIVEELHQALTDLRAELQASRAEAARAVKVAEQAIQSAENSSSKDWNSTVTHKAAEAAALAQKKSAEAMAKARLAEERLAGERKTATFWRKQAESAEEEASILQTRAAAAEVERAAMEQQLEYLHKNSARVVTALRRRMETSNDHYNQALDEAHSKSLSLEYELSSARNDLERQRREIEEEEALSTEKNKNQTIQSKVGAMVTGRLKKKSDDSEALLEQNKTSSCTTKNLKTKTNKLNSFSCSEASRLQEELKSFRAHFELAKRSISDELNSLPQASESWTKEFTAALIESQSETARLRERLSCETSRRRKLLNEVQDLRGNVCVYCRPKSTTGDEEESSLSFPSQEVILLNRDSLEGNIPPISFEFDRVFAPQASQGEVYAELEGTILSVLDGYNICLLSYGPLGAGKTFTMLGDIRQSKDDDDSDKIEISKHGIHLKAMEQLFKVADRRNERCQDLFSISIVEIYGEKLCDLIAGTNVGDEKGVVDLDLTTITIPPETRKKSRRRKSVSAEETSVPGNSNASRSNKSATTKLEIRTNNDGETYIQGLVSIQVTSFRSVVDIWKQALSVRQASNSHIMVTLRVVSRNVVTGVGSVGKIQFVDMAGAAVSSLSLKDEPLHLPTEEEGEEEEMNSIPDAHHQHTEKSIITLGEVVKAKTQFSRTIPYRNSTLTHLLSDALEGDTKVVVVASVGSEIGQVVDTEHALRLASLFRKVHVGKATKHILDSL